MNKKLPLLILLLIYDITGSAQPKVHFNFLSHNEETTQWNGTPYYTANRLKLISLANYFQSNGITWNMQSDWRYLSSVLTKETVALMASTNNKNILRWMFEDKGVEMDPHAHESQFIYPDVVYLMDSIGLPESKVMGGSIYNDSNGINVWTNLINGQYGLVFPNKFWQPDYMMGGGTPNHVDDLKYFGFWNPKDTAHYLVHDTTNHLRHIGVGCEIKIKDTISVPYILAQIHEVVDMVQSGQYPSNGFYLQTIFFEQGDLNDSAFYNKVIEITDSVNAIVASGVAQWSTLKQTYQEWETAYQAQMFQWECGQVVNTVNSNGIPESDVLIYPDPASTTLKIKTDEACGLKIFNSMGALVFATDLLLAPCEIDVRNFPRGIYYCLLEKKKGTVSGKIIVQ